MSRRDIFKILVCVGATAIAVGNFDAASALFAGSVCSFLEMTVPDKQVEIDVRVAVRTARAIKVDAEKASGVWVPLSQITDYVEEKDGSWSSIFIPEWLALEKGLI
jgi:hypothetical protein